MTSPDVLSRALSTPLRDAGELLRRGRRLEWFTLGWNVVGVVVLAVLAFFASLWELSETGKARQRRALQLIGITFVLPSAYLLVQSMAALITGHHASPGVGGITWTAVTAIMMFTLAGLKGRTGRARGNPVLATEARVIFVDGLVAFAVLTGIVLNLVLGWWWADPVAGFVIVYYAVREAIHIFRPGPE